MSVVFLKGTSEQPLFDCGYCLKESLPVSTLQEHVLQCVFSKTSASVARSAAAVSLSPKVYAVENKTKKDDTHKQKLASVDAWLKSGKITIDWTDVKHAQGRYSTVGTLKVVSAADMHMPSAYDGATITAGSGGQWSSFESARAAATVALYNQLSDDS